ncbi:hypothetical protein MAUB1S_00852 [Mycolicibacterium aubagnense]
MGDDRSRHQTDPLGTRRDPCGDEHGIQPTTDSIDAIIGLVRFVGLNCQRILDGHEVQGAAFSLDHQIGPIVGAKKVCRSRVGLPPRGRVPSGAVQSHGQMESARRIRHHATCLPDGYDHSAEPRADRARRDSAIATEGNNRMVAWHAGSEPFAGRTAMVTVKAASVPKTRDGTIAVACQRPNSLRFNAFDADMPAGRAALVTTRQVAWRTRSDQLRAAFGASVGHRRRAADAATLLKSSGFQTRPGPPAGRSTYRMPRTRRPGRAPVSTP